MVLVVLVMVHVLSDDSVFFVYYYQYSAVTEQVNFDTLETVDVVWMMTT